jgi:transcriptional regulator with XRE-family HTH domain
MNNEFGKLIKSSRLSNNLTLRGLAKICGISHAQLSKIENGVHLPSIESLQKICEALNLDYKELVDMSSSTKHTRANEEYVTNPRKELHEHSTRLRIFMRDDFTCRVCGNGKPNYSIDVFYFLPKETELDLYIEENQEKALEYGITVCSKCQVGLLQMKDKFDKDILEKFRERLFKNKK